MEIKGTVALVTGGASGLGAATVRELYSGGANVVIVDLPSSVGASLAAELGERAVFVAADITNADQVAAAVRAAGKLGELRITVNCAGIGSPNPTLDEKGPHPLETFSTIVNVDLIGTFNVIRLTAEAMSKTEPINGERGVIVNTASVAAFDGPPAYAAYAASKAGIVGMTLPIARDLANLKIRVITIAPGLFGTPAFVGSLPEGGIEALSAGVPHPSRLGEPDEYAALARHIVENPMLNGETIRLDGALRISPR